MAKSVRRSSRGQARVETPHEISPSPWLQTHTRSKWHAKNEATACKQDQEAPALEETSSWKKFPGSKWSQGSSGCKQEQETSKLKASGSPEPERRVQESQGPERKVRSDLRPPVKGSPGSEFPVVHVYNEYDEKSWRGQNLIRMSCEDERRNTRRRKCRASGEFLFADAIWKLA